MTKQYKSHAQWPEGTLCGYNNDVSNDSHYSYREAYNVCAMLEEQGFGGEGKVFPVDTWVTDRVEVNENE